jgi:hypothetical protein
MCLEIACLVIPNCAASSLSVGAGQAGDDGAANWAGEGHEGAVKRVLVNLDIDKSGG